MDIVRRVQTNEAQKDEVVKVLKHLKEWQDQVSTLTADPQSAKSEKKQEALKRLESVRSFLKAYLKAS